MNTFSEIVEAADNLTVDEQETLLKLLRQRLALRNREMLASEVADARVEYLSGKQKTLSVKNIMKEVAGES